MTIEQAKREIEFLDHYLQNYADDFGEDSHTAMMMAIKALETQRWILVTEDTPPKGTICLWCNKQGSVFTSAITNRIKGMSYVGKHGYFNNGLENYGDIVAWMPLPQPYREGEE